MRKVILFIASSLDGYIARKDGGIDWLFSDDDYGYKKFYSSVDTVIMGRKTYDVAKGFEKEPFAGKEVIVFSRKRDGCANDPVKASMQLKKKKGKNIWLVGGSQIISVLMNAGLVDEIINSVHPIIIGNGIPLFDRIDETSLKLINTKRFPSGLVQLHYDVKMRK